MYSMHACVYMYACLSMQVCVFTFMCIGVDAKCPLCNTITTEQGLLLSLDFADSGGLASQVVVGVSLSLLPESQFYRRLACMLGL